MYRQISKIKEDINEFEQEQEKTLKKIKIREKQFNSVLEAMEPLLQEITLENGNTSEDMTIEETS